jgi:hypothetical protein
MAYSVVHNALDIVFYVSYFQFVFVPSAEVSSLLGGIGNWSFPGAFMECDAVNRSIYSVRVWPLKTPET